VSVKSAPAPNTTCRLLWASSLHSILVSPTCTLSPNFTLPANAACPIMSAVVATISTASPTIAPVF
jgi:hypothetical protein